MEPEISFVYMAKSRKGEKRVTDSLKFGTGQLRETTPTENIGPPG